jgi:hypothetical protein
MREGIEKREKGGEITNVRDGERKKRERERMSDRYRKGVSKER